MGRPTCLENVVEAFCNFLGQAGINQRLEVLRVRCRNIHGLLLLLCRGRTAVHLRHSPVEHSQNTWFRDGDHHFRRSHLSRLGFSGNGAACLATCTWSNRRWSSLPGAGASLRELTGTQEHVGGPRSSSSDMHRPAPFTRRLLAGKRCSIPPRYGLTAAAFCGRGHLSGSGEHGRTFL